VRTEKPEFEKSFQISGVDCPVCAEEVRKELLKLDGIISANVNLDESKVSLKLKFPSITDKEIESVISELGVQIQKEGSKRTSIFIVDGMDCANEERVISEHLSKLEGIEELKFDLVNQKLFVTHSIAEGKIIKELNSIGFRAEIFHNKIHTKSTSKTKNYYQILNLVLSSLFVLVGFVAEYFEIHPTVTFGLFIFSIISGGYKIFHKAFLNTKKLIIDINVLMSIAVIGAVLIGKFSEAAVVMLLFAISLKLESFSIEKAKTSIHKLIALIPEFSTIKLGSEYKEIPTAEVKVGDILLIRPGEKIPVDGIVIDGATAVNQSTITGESKLIAKVKGDQCYAGTINQRGTILLEATTTYKNSQFSKILSLLEETTTNAKSNLQQVVDVFAKYYTPLIVIFAVIYLFYSFFILNHSLNESLYKGLVLLVISCPCALVISTPVAILSALTRSTKLGALVKGGIYLENLHRIQAIAFDKTGTLTEGNLQIEKIISLRTFDVNDLIQIAFDLEINSEHSIADAIVNYAKNQNLKPEQVEDFKIEEGAISGIVRNKKYKMGQPKLFLSLLNDEETQLVNKLENSGYTVILLFEEQIPIGIFCLLDTLRKSMKSTIEELKEEGIKEFFILSGDNKSIVEKIASELRINNYFAELKPEDKLRIVQRLNNKYKYFAMVGDGLNDAPALKLASIGIAMGKIGVDATIENSNITLIGDEISKLPRLIRLSRKLVNTIKENIFLSIFIKIIFIILTLAGVASMWGAIFADMGSSLIVIFNSLKLLKSKI